MSKYSVSFWCTHPDEENDDCNTGQDFDTKEAALAFYNDPANEYLGNYIEIDGPDLNEVRMKSGFDRRAYDREVERDRRAYEAEYRRECAMEAGMLHGVDAYNDEMGYG